MALDRATIYRNYRIRKKAREVIPPLRILGNLKEPFETSGQGLLGAMQATEDGGSLLCHECGRLYAYLAPHIIQSHRMSIREYKLKHGLYLYRKLVSPVVAEKMRQNVYKKLAIQWIKGPPRNAKPFGKNGGITNTYRSNVAEGRNMRGTCEGQLRERIVAAAVSHAVPPEQLSAHVDRSLFKAVQRRYGTWRRGKSKLLAVHYARCSGNYRTDYTAEKVLDCLKFFAKKHGRGPGEQDVRTNRELPSNGTIRRWFGTLNRAKMAAGLPITTQGFTHRWDNHQK